MATEKQEHPLDHTMTSIEVATVASKYDAEEVAVYITSMRPELVPVAIIRAQDVKKMLDTLVKIGESRIISDKIVPIGGQYVDPDTGILFNFKGDQSERKISNPYALRGALAEAGCPSGPLTLAIHDAPVVNFTELNKIAALDRKFAEIIEDHEAERKFRPPHFKEA